MKKQLFYIIFLGIVSQGCEQCEEKLKIRRTVNKTVPLSYVLNTTGTSNNTAIITASQVRSLFKSDEGTIEKIDVSGISLSGEIDKQQNTAKEAQFTAHVVDVNVLYGALLLKTTKLIKVSDNDLEMDLLGTGGKNPSFNNAISSLNEEGLKIIKDFFASVKPFSNSSIGVRLDSVVPANQRLVGTVYLKITASVSYYKCEKMPVIFLNNNDDICN